MDILEKKALILSTRLRFSPLTQPLKEIALEKIIEQNMLLADPGKGLSLREIEHLGAVYIGKRLSVLGRPEIESTLSRLVEKKRIVRKETDGIPNFSLSQEAILECQKLEDETRSRNQRIVSRLYENAEGEAQTYYRAFFDCVTSVFSALGESYVRLLKGDIQIGYVLEMPIINSEIRKNQRKYREINSEAFTAGIIRFFRETDPMFDELKWNLAQNYYIAKVVGFNQADVLLSKEVFGDSILYLDTNVLIGALEQKARHHRSFEILSDACRKLGIEVRVCQISLDELRRVVADRIDLLKRAADKIPDATAKKIRGVFYQLYADQIKEKGEVDFDTLFASFDNAGEKLESTYHVIRIDHPWFTENREDLNTRRLSEWIRQQSNVPGRRHKGLNSALHDALLLRWIQDEQETESHRAWLVTLDTLLARDKLRGDHGLEKAGVITLDALLQWITPLAIADENEDVMSTIFAEALRYHLLPQESFFDLRDFLMFNSIEMSVRQLPSKDVEDCVRYIKKAAPTLNPENPRDREKLAHEISKFFEDPARKYKEELTVKEKEIKEQGAIITDLEKRLAELERQATNGRIHNEKLRRARVRLGISAIAAILYEFVMLLLVSRLGSGENLLQKIAGSALYFSIGVPLFLLAGWFLIGKQGLRILGWPFTKIFKQ